jgi:hypothetical protein
LSTCYGCPVTPPNIFNPVPSRVSNRCKVPDNCDSLWWDPIACKCLCNSPSCAYKDTSRPIQSEKEFLNVGGNTNGSGNNPNDNGSGNNPNDNGSGNNPNDNGSGVRNSAAQYAIQWIVLIAIMIMTAFMI